MNLIYRDIIQNTQKSTQLLATSALAIPIDKRAWSPGGVARTTISILQECATFPTFTVLTLANRRMPNEAEIQALVGDVDLKAASLETLIEVMNRQTEKLVESIKAFPEADLEKEMTFPWGTYTMLGVMGFHYWNNTYHLGQINYLQMILGDAEMHM